MKIIISPAKKLDTSLKVINRKMNTSFLKASTELIKILKKMSVLELKDLMGLSDSLAQLNWQRYQDWDIENKNTYKALELFNGTVYEGIDVKHEYQNFFKNLGIFAGLLLLAAVNLDKAEK